MTMKERLGASLTFHMHDVHGVDRPIYINHYDL